MNRVFVLSSTKKPLMPCTPARARRLLRDGKAAVYRMRPFTIILKFRAEGETQAIEFKADPGSKITGIALVALFERGRVLIWAANLQHRGQAIRAGLESRRSLRRGRRGRRTRYREARFNNRTRPAGWLPPSLKSRVNNLKTWYGRLLGLAPIISADVETVRFDTHALIRPGLSGVEYQQGELAGYEVREYLLEKWNRQCAYCGKSGIPLQIEHIHARSRGGSNRVSNLTLACEPCNTRKGARALADFLADRPDLLRRILAHAMTPLRDAAAVNATRYAIGGAIHSMGRPTGFWSGGRTKFNRAGQGYPKDHFIDAACVGETGACVEIAPDFLPLTITATGRGTRQVVRTDRYGFPRGTAGRCKRVHGFQTGDLVRLVQSAGKYAGIHVGRLAGVRADGRFDIRSGDHKITSGYKNFHLIQRGDGYDYRIERAA
jgi:hypothetical protein